ELLDGISIRAVEQRLSRTIAPPGTGAMLIIEVDGVPGAVEEEADRVATACLRAGAIEVQRAANDQERDAIWEARRELSYALRALAPRKINHDLVVPRGRVPELFELIDR